METATDHEKRWSQVMEVSTATLSASPPAQITFSLDSVGLVHLLWIRRCLDNIQREYIPHLARLC